MSRPSAEPASYAVARVEARRAASLDAAAEARRAAGDHSGAARARAAAQQAREQALSLAQQAEPENDCFTGLFMDLDEDGLS